MFYTGHVIQKQSELYKTIVARSAFTFGSAKSEMFFSFSFVLLRKIIDFCEGEMEGPRIVLPTGSLTHRFFGVRKVDPSKLALATGIGRFRDPLFGRKQSGIFEKHCKK